MLGICLGMQLMCRHSEEGDVDCLGIFDTDVDVYKRQSMNYLIINSDSVCNIIQNIISIINKSNCENITGEYR